VSGRFRPTVIRFQKPWQGCVVALVAFAALILVGRWNFGMVRRYQLVDFNESIIIALLLCLLAITTLCLRYVWPTGAVWPRLTSSLSAGLFVTLLVGLGGYHQLNATLDHARPSPRTYLIESLNCSSGRHSTPRISLRPLDPLSVRFNLELSRTACRASLPGDTVHVELKPGFFGSQWVAQYRVVRRNR
jgi:hypothetical protein